MKRLLIVLGIAVLIIYAVFLGYLFAEKQKEEPVAPLDTAVPFASSSDRVFPTEPVSTDLSVRIDHMQGTASTTPPLTHFERYRLEKLEEIYSQAVLLPGVDDYRLLTQDIDFVARAYKVDGAIEIVVLLTETPYTETQEHAELTLAHMFEMERDDLCGFPITIREAADGALGSDVKTERPLVCRKLLQE